MPDDSKAATEASNNHNQSQDVFNDLLDGAIEHDAEVSALEGISAKHQDELKPRSNNAKRHHCSDSLGLAII